MEYSWLSVSLNDYSKIALEVLSILNEKNITLLCLKGDLGAGKTTFSKAVFKLLGVIDEVQSPTFSIVNEYHDHQGQSFYHFDFYRIENLEEVFDIGYEDYFYAGRLCVIEWPEMIEGLLNLPKALIFIGGEGDTRNIKLEI